MSNLLKRGALWLGREKRKFAAEHVAIVRGSSSITVRAEIGKHLFQIDNGDGTITEYESRDYLIFADEYCFNGVAVEPAAGDQVIECRNASGGGFAYGVMAPAGQQVWQWSDEFRQRYRVHTKYLGPNPQP